MIKKCNCCERKHEVKNCIRNAYALTDWGYWFNCQCGSTLLIQVSVIDYSKINQIVTKEPANVLNYKRG